MRLLAIIFLAVVAYGQGSHNGDWTQFGGRFDTSGATITAPFAKLTTPPTTCSVGDFYYKTNDTLYERLKECSATNTWITFGVAGGAGTGNVTNTGTAVVGAIPRATSTTGAAVAPSLFLVDASGNASTPGGASVGVGTIYTGKVDMLPGTSANFQAPIPTGMVGVFLDSANGDKLTRRTPGGTDTVIEQAGEATNPTNSGATGAAVLKTGTNLVARKLKAGANVTITENADDIEIASSGGGGSTTGLYSSTLNFSAAIPPGGFSTQTFTATGLAAGSSLAVSWPTALPAGITPRVLASATNTVQVQLHNDLDTSITPGSGTYSVRDLETLGYLTGSATIDWGSLVPGQCSTNTITVTGAAAGDNVAVGLPAALNTGLKPRAVITAANTVTLQLCNGFDESIDAASGAFKASVTK